MRRHLALAATLSLLFLGCTESDPEPEPQPAPAEEDDDQGTEAPVQGLRVGVVLPPRDTGAADELEVDRLGVDVLADRFEDDVIELRAVAPDAAEFVPDVATLLAVEDYDVVCVLGPDAAEVVGDVASRHAATRFCGAPVEPTDSAPDNVMHVDVALAELGHVVGVALGQLGGEDPVSLIGTRDRAGARAFRDGVRAGVGQTPLRETDIEPDRLEEELAAAVEDDVAAIAVDAGPGSAELLADVEGVPLLAPAPLFGEEGRGALRWRVRWERVLEVVLDHHLEDEALPARLTVTDRVFGVEHGDRASPTMVEAVEAALGEFERGARDPLASRAPEEDEDEADADGDATGADAAPEDEDAE